jgi:hypothetical protein
MTFDAADGYLVLFGGWTYGPAHPSGKFLNDTWKFASGTWTAFVPRSGPSGRSFASITYDAHDGYVLLFGGCRVVNPSGVSACVPNIPPTALNDTWTFLNGTWGALSIAGPSARFSAGMTYDPTWGEAILFGGESSSRSLSNETWAYVAGSWTLLTPSSSPPPQAGNPLVFDGKAGRLLLFQGIAGGNPRTAVWRFR